MKSFMPASIKAKDEVSVSLIISTLASSTPAFPIIDLPGSNKRLYSFPISFTKLFMVFSIDISISSL